MTSRFIPIYEPFLGEEERNNLIDAFDSSWISSSGKYISKFEQEFAKWNGNKYATSTSNGTTSLHLALEALKIKKGDDVLVPNFTFISPVNMVKLVGANPVLVDVNLDDWCINYELLEKYYTPNTKAVIPVHIYGTSANMDEIKDFAEDKNLFIIEDVAEAPGAKFNGKRTGTIGDIASYSFYGNKIITTGEGGMITTDSEELIEEVNLLKNHGMKPSKRYYHEKMAFNYRMTNLQAAIGLAQLQKIDMIIEKKRENWFYLEKLAKEIDGVVPQKESDLRFNVSWLNSILLPDGIDVSEFSQELRTKNIDSRRFFYPINQMPPYSNNNQFPNSEILFKRGISLPSSMNLTFDDIDHIVDNIRSLLS